MKENQEIQEIQDQAGSGKVQNGSEKSGIPDFYRKITSLIYKLPMYMFEIYMNI